jgi:simple sugar transport system permease protein
MPATALALFDTYCDFHARSGILPTGLPSLDALLSGGLCCGEVVELCGLAGSYLVLAQSANFSAHMTAGRGFMALAALIFGRWNPWGALGACLLFGLLDAIAMRLQGVDIPGIGAVPVQAIQALPYLMTVVLLAGFVGRAVAPAALGKPYLKNR